MILKTICFFFLSCVMPFTVSGQNIKHNDTFIVQHYTDDDGLPQNSVKSIAQDMYGFVWMTTEDGLVRFDGRHFFVFGRGNALRSSRFWSLSQDWSDKSFCAFNQSGEALRISNGKAVRDSSFVLKKIKLLEVIPWLHLPDPRFGVTGIPDEINGRITLAPDTCIIVRPGERVFVYTSGIIAEYISGEKARTFHYQIPNSDRFFCVDTALFYFREDGLIANIIDEMANNVLSLTGDISSAQLRLIPENQQKLFWNNTDNGSLVLSAGDNFYQLTYSPGSGFHARIAGEGFNATDNKITCALYDNATHKLFVGSSVTGLYVFSSPVFRVLSSPPPMDNVYYAHTVFQENKILTAQGIITDIEGRKKTVLGKPPPTDKYSLITDSKGFVWTKKDRTLFRMHPTDLHIIQQWTLESSIQVLYEGKNHKIYIGCADQQIQIINLEDDFLSVKKFCSLPSIPKCFFETNTEGLWVGMETGLCKIDTDKKIVTNIREAGTMSVRSLYGYDNELWISTYEHGFFLYHKKRLTSFPVDKHQFLLTTHCIVEDRMGFFWITTNKGLFKTSRADLISYAEGISRGLRYQYYSKEDGFLTNEFNGGCQPCGLLLPNGWISFPSMNGLVCFNPDSVDVNRPKSELFIDEVLLDGKETTLANIIPVSRNTRQIKILVSSPDWRADNSGFLDYALVRDSDTLWLPVESDNVITLSTLPWGNHTLVIRKINGFEKEKFVYRSLQFTVDTPWYFSYQFIIVFGIFVILLLRTLIRQRTKWIRAKNRLLEEKIGHKTQELRKALEALQTSADELALRTRIQEKMIASISHDVKVPMGFLKVVSEDMHGGLQSGKSGDVLYQSRLVKDHVARLYFFMQNLLDYSKSQMGSDFSLDEKVIPAAIILEKKELFADIAAQTSTQLTIDIQPELTVRTNKILLGVIIHNLIDNAIKVSEAGNVKIATFKKNDEIIITIEDSGAGIPAGVLEWLNDPAKENVWERPGFKGQSTGIGLYIVKDLAALLDIELSATNSPNGSKISLRVHYK